jgi:hypothetical protein
MSIDNIDPVSLGYKVWTMVRPWRRLKIALNKRRARLGKPLLPITEDDDNMLPNGTMTYTGAAGAIATPIVTTLLTASGIGECAAAELAANPQCVGASQLAGMLITAAFGIVAVIGRKRAAARHAAELAAAQASKP